MKSGYKIVSTTDSESRFFYLANYTGLNEIELLGFAKNEDVFFKRTSATTGVWKIKTLKN